MGINILHILRNPYGYPSELIRQAQLVAADIIEYSENELACLIPDPSTPKEDDWPCSNPADRNVLQSVFDNLYNVELEWPQSPYG